MIAYSMSADGNGTASTALYVYDLESVSLPRLQTVQGT